MLHKPELDELTPAEMRVIAEYLLYTMEIPQRRKFSLEYPGLYKKVYPSVELPLKAA